MHNEIEKGLIKVFDLWKDWCHNQIKEIAYYKWINAGRPHGYDVYFWTEAEREWWTNNRIEVTSDIPPSIELNPENNVPETITVDLGKPPVVFCHNHEIGEKIPFHEDFTEYDIPPQIFAKG